MTDSTFNSEIDDIYSMFLDYEDDGEMKWDVDIVPRLQDLLQSVRNAALEECAELVLACGELSTTQLLKGRQRLNGGGEREYVMACQIRALKIPLHNPD